MNCLRNLTLGIGLLTTVVAGGLAVPSALAATTGANSTTVQPGNTFWTISRAYGVSIQALEAANPSVTPMDLIPGTVLTLPSLIGTGQSNSQDATSPQAVTVQPGDTMWTISQAYGVSLQAIETANQSVNPNNLLVGTALVLPKTGALAGDSSTKSSAAITSTQTSTVQQQDLYWMEHAINAEAGADSLQAQIAVGDVILHRLQAGGYGSTVHDVVFQVINGHYQFTSVANGYIYTTPSVSSIQAAMDVLNKGEDVVPSAMVFYNPTYTPTSSWVRSQPYLTQIDNLIFAK